MHQIYLLVIPRLTGRYHKTSQRLHTDIQIVRVARLHLNLLDFRHFLLILCDLLEQVLRPDLGALHEHLHVPATHLLRPLVLALHDIPVLIHPNLHVLSDLPLLTPHLSYEQPDLLGHCFELGLQLLCAVGQ